MQDKNIFISLDIVRPYIWHKCSYQNCTVQNKSSNLNNVKLQWHTKCNMKRRRFGRPCDAYFCVGRPSNL